MLVILHLAFRWRRARSSVVADGVFIDRGTVGERVYDPSPFEHFRPTDGAADPGVYRVVGRPGDEVTLLRVADEDGRRVHTGEVVRHPVVDFPASFERASNPDGRPILDWIRRGAFVLVAGGASAQFLGVGGPLARWVTLSGAALFLLSAFAQRTNWF